MSLGWLWCIPCQKYRKWQEYSTDDGMNMYLDCGLEDKHHPIFAKHHAIDDTDTINHKEYQTDDAYEKDFPDGEHKECQL